MIPVHPTQLYESIGCLALFAFTYYYVRPRRRKEGEVIGAMLIGYAIVRSLCEIFRNDERGVLGRALDLAADLAAAGGAGLYCSCAPTSSPLGSQPRTEA